MGTESFTLFTDPESGPDFGDGVGRGLIGNPPASATGRAVAARVGLEASTARSLDLDIGVRLACQKGAKLPDAGTPFYVGYGSGLQ